MNYQKYYFKFYQNIDMIERLPSQIDAIRLLCSSKKQAIMACNNPLCKQSSFVCGDENCQCHIHHSCSLIKNDQLITLLQKHQSKTSKETQKSIDVIFQIYDTALEYINLKKTEFQQKISEKIDKQPNDFLDLLAKGQTEKIDGKKISDIVSKCKQQSSSQFYLEIPSFYQTLKTQITQQLKNICEKIKIIEKDWNQSLNSNIIDEKDKAYIMSYLRKQSAKFNLLFRGKENNFNKQKFLSKCQQIPNILILCITDENKRFAGYLQTGWFSPEKTVCQFDCGRCYQYLSDQQISVGGNAFVLNLSDRIDYPCNRKDNQTRRKFDQWYDSMTGPTIGSCQNDFVFQIRQNNQNFGQGSIFYTQEVASIGQSNVQFSFRVQDYEIFQIK